MWVAIVVAVIALISAMVSAGLSFYFQSRTAKEQEEREAAKVLAKYREPLIFAAYDLQSRLFNILRQNFLGKYYLEDQDGSRQYAVEHTLFLIGQYFAWTEILRREVQFLQFEEEEETKKVSDLLFDVRDAFADDAEELGRPFMIWRGEQDAIGERMIVVEEGQRYTIGFATFAERAGKPQFRRWFERLVDDIDEIAVKPNRRLRKLQHSLIDLVTTLDEGGVRFKPEKLRKV